MTSRAELLLDLWGILLLIWGSISLFGAAPYETAKSHPSPFAGIRCLQLVAGLQHVRHLKGQHREGKAQHPS